MAKQRPSLEAFAQAGQAAAPVVLVEQAGPLDQNRPAPKSERKDRPHTTLYLDKRVQKVLKEIALQYDCKPHDLYLEGIEYVLKHYGRPSLRELMK